jgi:hypothetical protein
VQSKSISGNTRLAYEDALKLQDMLRAYRDGVTPIDLPGNKVGMYDGKYTAGEELVTMYLDGCIATILHMESENGRSGILTHFTQRQWINNLEKVEELINKNVKYKVSSCTAVIIAPDDLSIHADSKSIEVLSLGNSICGALSGAEYKIDVVPYQMFSRRSGMTVAFRPNKREWESQQHGIRKL